MIKLLQIMNITQSKAKNATPAQGFIEVQNIKDDIVILKNGGLRAVCIASSINFDLRGDEEQEAIIGRFQGFVNSLDFSLQILINSRKLDIEPYLNELRELAKIQENELLHTQTLEYVDFIQKFVEMTDIMNKSFYLVIPYNPVGVQKESFVKSFVGKIKYLIKPKETIQKLSPEKFDTYKEQLMQRVNHIISGLSQMEIKSVMLSTGQLIRLFYEFYNPGK